MLVIYLFNVSKYPLCRPKFISYDTEVQRLPATAKVDERPRSGRPRKATPREDRLIGRYVRRNRFTTSARIRDELNFGSYVSSKDC